MKKAIILILILMFILSCKRKEKTYYKEGSIETIVNVVNSKYHGLYQAFYEDGKLEIEGNYEQDFRQGLFTYYYRRDDSLSKSHILFKNDTAYYRRDYDKSGELVEEGSLAENSKAGKWMHYVIENGYVKKIQEVFYINGKSHLNQEWGLNREGDTIGGRYYVLDANDTLDFHNQVIRFRVEWLPYYINSEIYVCIPNKKSKPFDSYFSNMEEVVLDTIGNPDLWQENNLDEYRNGSGVITINLNYDTSGKKILRGYLLEKKSFADIDTLEYDLVTRKIYFEKEIFIRD